MKQAAFQILRGGVPKNSGYLKATCKRASEPQRIWQNIAENENYNQFILCSKYGEYKSAWRHLLQNIGHPWHATINLSQRMCPNITQRTDKSFPSHNCWAPLGGKFSSFKVNVEFERISWNKMISSCLHFNISFIAVVVWRVSSEMLFQIWASAILTLLLFHFKLSLLQKYEWKYCFRFEHQPFGFIFAGGKF